MESINKILLSLYRSTIDVPYGDYSQWVFSLLQSAFPFDSAGRTNLDTRTGNVLIVGSDLYREDTKLLGDWQTVNRYDPVLAHGLSQPGRATTFHVPTLARSMYDAGMRRYVQNNPHHQNGMVILAPTIVGGHWDALGFYRSHTDQQFSHRDKELVQILAPHVLQAIKINMCLAGAVESASNFSTAIVRANGQLQYLAPSSAALLRLEWPEWPGYVLPAQMTNALCSSSERSFKGKHIVATADISGELMVLQIKALSPLASLSDREAVVAQFYGTGLSTKEIARRMNIAPNTVRNFVQRVYKKLNVNDKAALAVFLSGNTNLQ